MKIPLFLPVLLLLAGCQGNPAPVASSPAPSASPAISEADIRQAAYDFERETGHKWSEVVKECEWADPEKRAATQIAVSKLFRKSFASVPNGVTIKEVAQAVKETIPPKGWKPG